MMQGIVIDPAPIASAISKAAFENGLVIETSGAEGEVIKLLPPLIIEFDELERGLDILENAVRSTAATVSTGHTAGARK
jgi:diaminobutyrate-2-oxoglutarate transaminase